MAGSERPEGGHHPLPKSRFCLKASANNLSSVWYGLFVTVFQTYIAIHLATHILDCLEMDLSNQTVSELQMCLALTGISVLLLPFFLAASLIKVGNFANDGTKLGRADGTTGLEPAGKGSQRNNSSLACLWRHGGPTAPFVHVLSAFCLLVSNLILQARLIQADYLPRGYVWKTDLDFILSSYDQLTVLSFMPSGILENTTVRPTNSGQVSTTSSPQHMMFVSNRQELPFNDEDQWGPVSLEFLNYVLALAVYAVRYPAVFWKTNKCWGAIFSFQLFINGIQNILVYVGVCVLYKVHVLGPSEILTSIPARFSNSFFLLNPHVTLALLVLTTLLVLSSSLVLYLYGYGRYNAFLTHEKACKVISVEGREWGYLTHCAALCVLLAITVVEGPLLVDLAVIYKSSVDRAALVSVVGAVLHLFIWVVLWLGLTLKHNWKFNVIITVGKAGVKSARSIKLLTDVELVTSSNSCDTSSCAPLLVVASGRTYTITDTSPKRTIITAIHKAALERKSKLQSASNSVNKKEQYDDDEEQIYWLRPKPLSPKNSPDSEVSDGVSWHKKAVTKPKVTFEQVSKRGSKEYGGEDDDGDYARLRELPLLGQNSVQHGQAPLIKQDIKKVHYMTSGNAVVPVASDYEDPNPLIIPDPPQLPPPQSDTPTTPRCLLRADSGMPHDLTPRSESETSGSPPDHSETSSGVHSNSSRESHGAGGGNSNGENNTKSRTQWEVGRAVMTDSGGEVVIRRRPCGVAPVGLSSDTGPTSQDKFGRSTNMRMTSFTDGQSSATLPHFPTQGPIPRARYPNCSTMPLPLPLQQQPVVHYPGHSTIPTHHNGVRLFSPNPVERRPIIHRYAHHSFPQLMNPIKHNISNISERDSANFSMASSGESETYHS